MVIIMISIIKKALISLTRTPKKGATGQCSYMGTTTNYESIHPYGYYALPEQGSMVLLQSVLGDESNKVGIEYDNKKIKDILAILKPGDNAVYNPTSGSHIIFRKTGDIEVKADGPAKVKIEADVEFTGDLEITGDVMITGNITLVGDLVAATGTVTAANMAATTGLVAGGKDIVTHTHAPGSFNIGGTPVTGESSGMS